MLRKQTDPAGRAVTSGGGESRSPASIKVNAEDVVVLEELVTTAALISGISGTIINGHNN